jgi:CheY-like chemotaxis protein
LWPVCGDATQIYQVLMNLCLNARDAMPSGGRLMITAENIGLTDGHPDLQLGCRPGPYVLLRISDTGTGIAPELIDKIFDPFFTTKEVGKGTGLGLSTVMGIIRSHTGFVQVSSEIGRGSIFSVYLPAVPSNQAVPEPVPRPVLPAGNGELILVVDDERAIRDVVRETLEMNGYRVLTASNGTEALTLFLKNRSDIKLVLTDLMMPIMDGLSTIGALQSLEPKLRVIASTGLGVNGTLPDIAAKHTAAFLPKPFTPDALLKMLRETLAAE